MNEVERLAKVKTSQINQALGVFIFVFGVIVTFAMVYTETFVQQMTDMVAGLVLMAIGGGMIWKSTRVLKKLQPKKEK